MEFRIAREKDLERMCEITAQAKADLKILDWISGRKDIHREKSGRMILRTNVLTWQKKMESFLESLHFRQHRTYLIMK